jgi:TPR repeat protein
MPPQRQFDSEEIAILVKRGKGFISNGDPAGARVMLRRAAESKNAEAALMLAATYDPVVLRELKVNGVAADVAMARTWYEKAKEFGSEVAPRLLEILASATR